MKKVHHWNCVVVALIAAVGVTLGGATGVPSAYAASVDGAATPSRTHITVVNFDGHQSSTPGGDEPVKALSLAKLYLAYWVLYHGAVEDKLQVYEMIRVSHDGIAAELDRKYPQAIPEVIEHFELKGTSYPGHWGGTTTTTNDMARFIKTILFDPIAQPVIEGMRQVAPAGADGYSQDFGTALLGDIAGTKFGWADSHDQHASVSIGPDFVVVAHTYGSAEEHTEDVLKYVHTTAEATPATPTAPAAPSEAERITEKLNCIPPEDLVNVMPDGIAVPEDILNAVPLC